MGRFTNFISQTNPAVTSGQISFWASDFSSAQSPKQHLQFSFNVFNVFMLKVYRILLKINLATDVLIIICREFSEQIFFRAVPDRCF